MLLTCNVASIASQIDPEGRGKPRLRLEEVPRYVREELLLHGMNLSTDLLAGATRDSLVHLRERADKEGCSCLLLIEPDPQPFAADQEAARAAADRVRRVLEAAHLLGCNSAAISIAAPDTDEAFDIVASRMREAMERAERLELNLLLRPATGLTQTPERLTDLIKKIGGFRVGTLPDFQDAAASDDPQTYLRRLTPYASVVLASTVEFGEPTESAAVDDDKPGSLDDLAEMLMGDHTPAPHLSYDLAPLIEAVGSVGFDGTLAIDYRGGGDGTMGVHMSREAIEAAVESLAE